MALSGLETARLIIRPVRPDDLTDMHEYMRQPNVGPNAGWAPHKTESETQTVMQQLFLGHDDIFAIVLKETGRVVGNIGLVPDAKRENPKSRNMGYALASKYWGFGYMTEAALAVLEYGFNKLRLDIISAYCYSFNSRSRRVMQKCGMTYEGCMRLCETVYNGEVRDNECWSITRDEYFAAGAPLSIE